jgi:hypothetical protein
MGWIERHAGRRLLRTVGIGAVLAAACASVGLAAVRPWVFADMAGVSDAELEDMRGGFTFPSLPHVRISFGFVIHNRADLPGMTDPTDVAGQVTISPSLVALVDGGDVRSPAAGSMASGLGTQIESTTKVEFSDPTHATVQSEGHVNGTVVSDTQRLVDLTKNTISLRVGRPDAALITQHLDVSQVSTLMESVLGNTSLRSQLAASITLEGWDRFRNSLPSPAMVRGVRALEDAVKMSVR